MSSLIQFYTLFIAVASLEIGRLCPLTFFFFFFFNFLFLFQDCFVYLGHKKDAFYNKDESWNTYFEWKKKQDILYGFFM